MVLLPSQDLTEFGLYEYLLIGSTEIGWQNSNLFSNLEPGLYQSWIRNLNQNQCFIKGPEIEVLGYDLSVSQKTKISPSCEKNNGRISLSGNGGIPGNYEYGLQHTLSESGPRWNSTGEFGNLFAGTYRTFIRNASDKSCATEGSSITLTNSSLQPQLTIVSQRHTSCGNVDGQIVLSGSGGSGSYLFRLSDGPWQSNGTFNGLSQGYYTPEIKNNTSGSGSCREAGEVVQIEGSELISAIIERIENTSCGFDNGLIVLKGVGSSGTYEFKLNNGPWQTSGLFLNIASGVYTPYVRSSTDLSCVKSIAPVSITTSNGISVSLNNKALEHI